MLTYNHEPFYVVAYSRVFGELKMNATVLKLQSTLVRICPRLLLFLSCPPSLAVTAIITLMCFI